VKLVNLLKMEENTEDQPTEIAVDSKEETEENEELVDLSNFEHIEKILENDSSTKLKFLDFERQMFLDSIYNDGLVICAK
jgi:hypothetical protein